MATRRVRDLDQEIARLRRQLGEYVDAAQERDNVKDILTRVRAELGVSGSELVSARRRNDELEIAVAGHEKTAARLREEIAELRDTIVSAIDSRDEIKRDLALRDEAIKAHLRNIDALKESKGRLKEVARFYRAQRDRVDAYLSGVIDTTRDARAAALKHELARAPVMPMPAPMAAERIEMSQRPDVREPFVRASEAGDGHDYAVYRDEEPRGWEEL